MFRQEVQGKLDQEASDFAQFLLSPGLVSLGQSWFGLELLQLRHVSHQGRGKATENLGKVRRKSFSFTATCVALKVTLGKPRDLKTRKSLKNKNTFPLITQHTLA